MRNRIWLALSIAAVAPAAGQTRTPFDKPALYDLPPFHSQISFMVPFMGLSSVRGSFEDFEGRLLLDPSRPESSAVVVAIDASSIHTGVEKRDQHLRSTDFLDVERFPSIVFRSDRVTRNGNGYVAHGQLTMHGVTRPIAIPFSPRHAPVHDENGLDYAGFDGELMLNWRDFGIAASNAHNSWFQPAKMLVNDSVRVTLSVEAEHRPKNDRATVVLLRGAFDSSAAQLRRRAAGSP